jgi:hypothetical protein
MSPGNAMVTRCPARTSTGNLFPPNSRIVDGGVKSAPTRARGPATTLRGSVKASGKFASEFVEQSSTTPCGRAFVTLVAAWTAAWGGARLVSEPPQAASSTAPIAATVSLSMHRVYACGAASVPAG